MKVFITGGSGLVGSNIMKHFSLHGHEIIGTYFNYKTKDTVHFNSIDKNDEGFNLIRKFKPDVIIHCGALTNVDYCESNIEESYSSTVISAKNISEVAQKINSKMIYISTDYVFDGKDGGPYSESAEPLPLQVYGQHKLDAEFLTSKLNDHLIIRVTGVYGHEERGKNFVSRLIQWMSSGEEKTLKLPYDQYSTPINAYDIARAILLLITNNKKGIYHLGGTDYLNRVQLANRVNLYFPDSIVKIISTDTSSLEQAAKRPLSGGLKTAKFSSEFPEFKFSNIDDFITKKHYV